MKYFSFLMIFVLIACDVIQYNPDEGVNSFYDEPIIDSNIVVFDEKQDTLFASGQYSIYYKTANPIYINYITINDRIIDSTTSRSVYVLNTEKYNNGYYLLRFDFFLHSNSKSLADRLGMEALHVTIQKILIINNKIPKTVLIDDINWYEGKSKLNWGIKENAISVQTKPK